MTTLILDVMLWVLLAGAVTALVCLWFVIVAAYKLTDELRRKS